MGVSGGVIPESVFFAWQSDHKKTNLNFIEDALECAIKAVNRQDGLKLDPAPDRDTKGVPGSPNIAATIFEKIRDCAVFVCDVSIVNADQPGGRRMPNPNVMLETGYAIALKGWDKVILVANVAFGSPEDLPFDLRGHRILRYRLMPEADEKAEERKKLVETLTEAIRAALGARTRP